MELEPEKIAEYSTTVTTNQRGEEEEASSNSVDVNDEAKGGETSNASTTGRGKMAEGRGKDLKLLRQHYGVLKLRQSKLEDHFGSSSTRVHPKKRILDWQQKCQILRAQARKYTIVDLLKLA